MGSGVMENSALFMDRNPLGNAPFIRAAHLARDPLIYHDQVILRQFLAKP